MRPTYHVELTAVARRQLDRLPAPIQVRVRLAIRPLAVNPRPLGAALLAGPGSDRVWRIRVGDYRLLYQVRDDVLLVLLVKAGHRREIYGGGRISESDAPYEALAEPSIPRGGRSWTSELVHRLRDHGRHVSMTTDEIMALTRAD